MAAEAVQYIQGMPVLQDGLAVDHTLLMCSQCEAEYRVHYSQGELAWLDELRFQAGEEINSEHPNHLPTLSLTHDGIYPNVKK